MKLDFAALAGSDSLQPSPKPWGQAGTTGTPVSAPAAASPAVGDASGTGGDVGFRLPAPGPRLSPSSPPPPSAGEANGLNVSPVSPPVPVPFDTGRLSEDFDREAFEERAAIMEFDGGMTRVAAEAAATTSMKPRG